MTCAVTGFVKSYGIIVIGIIILPDIRQMDDVLRRRIISPVGKRYFKRDMFMLDVSLQYGFGFVNRRRILKIYLKRFYALDLRDVKHVVIAEQGNLSPAVVIIGAFAGIFVKKLPKDDKLGLRTLFDMTAQCVPLSYCCVFSLVVEKHLIEDRIRLFTDPVKCTLAD